MKEPVDLTCVIPCYNEGPTLKSSIQELIDVLDNTRLRYELIFIDDASTDQTAAVLRSIVPGFGPKARFISNPRNYGRGKTVKTGFMDASGDVVGFLDIDLEIHPIYILRFMLAIQRGADAAIAWRTHRIPLVLFYRWVMHVGYQRLRQIVLGQRIHDTEAGFKFFKRKSILPVLKKTVDEHWFWDTEIVTRAYMAGLKVEEIPVLFVKRDDKKSTVNPLRDSSDYVRSLFRLRNIMRMEEKSKVK